MKKIQTLTLGAAVASALVSTSAISSDLTANLGLVSDYYFRGVQQVGTGATGSAGIDYGHDSGAYVGIWAADVGGHSGGGAPNNGIEYDIYFGYGGEINGIEYGIGYTSYQYTNDLFDSAYNEFNITASYKGFGFEFSSGTHDAIAGTTVNSLDEDYTFTALSYSHGDLAATYGIWGDQLEGTYFQIDYTKTFSEIDFGVSLINGDAEDSPGANARNFASDGTALVFSISKTFDL